MTMHPNTLRSGSLRRLHAAHLAWAFMGACAVSSPALAQFDPAKVKAEPAAVAARFPDPVVSYQTPGLQAGRTDFASHDEVIAYLKGLIHPAIKC